MIVGDINRIGIESSIAQAYEHLGMRALGLFVLHVGGQRFGVYAPDATMLACSFDSVVQRIEHRGLHDQP
ncbi:MAG: Imm42 family immunity protein [Pirellulales bacterium]